MSAWKLNLEQNDPVFASSIFACSLHADQSLAQWLHFGAMVFPHRYHWVHFIDIRWALICRLIGC